MVIFYLFYFYFFLETREFNRTKGSGKATEKPEGPKSRDIRDMFGASGNSKTLKPKKEVAS